jgi:cellulose synthase/poly-beta-1,6-N-acetylglucosamine synthase-like glycosyltransferase
MTEDMDLSYRAQLAGWQSLYMLEVDAPAELPAQMEAFKRQQARWAKGSIQCLRKLGWPILRSDLTIPQKLMALVHISSYLTHPLMILLLLVMLPMALRLQPAHLPLLALAFATIGPPLLYVVAQGALHRDWKKRVLYFPFLAAVCAGITWSTSRAVWQGLTTWGGTFARTPKFRLEGRQGGWSRSVYRLLPDRAIAGEILLMLYALATAAVAWTHGNYGAVPFLLLYVGGFGMVAGMSLYQGLRRA